MSKTFAITLDKRLPRMSVEYMAGLFADLKEGACGSSTLGAMDLAMVKSWFEAGEFPRTRLDVVEEARDAD